jgi:hypothetical protein
MLIAPLQVAALYIPEQVPLRKCLPPLYVVYCTSAVLYVPESVVGCHSNGSALPWWVVMKDVVLGDQC